MKKILILSAAFLLFSSNVVLAQTGQIKNYIDDTTTGIEKNLNFEARPGERKFLGKLTDDRKENFRDIFQKMLLKIKANTKRLEILISKTEQKINSISEKQPSINLNQPKLDLQKAKDNLSDAKTNIDNAEIQVQNLFASDNPREEFFELKGLITDIKTDLQETRRLLVKIITQIKKVEGQTK